MFGRVLIKPVEIAIWPAEFAKDLYRPLIYILSISATDVVTSILVNDVLVRVLTDAVDLVSSLLA